MATVCKLLCRERATLQATKRIFGALGVTQYRGLSLSAIQNVEICKTSSEAVRDITDGSKLLVGGFGLCGIPENLIRALKIKEVKDLTVVSNNVGLV